MRRGIRGWGRRGGRFSPCPCESYGRFVHARRLRKYQERVCATITRRVRSPYQSLCRQRSRLLCSAWRNGIYLLPMPGFAGELISGRQFTWVFRLLLEPEIERTWELFTTRLWLSCYVSGVAAPDTTVYVCDANDIFSFCVEKTKTDPSPGRLVEVRRWNQWI